MDRKLQYKHHSETSEAKRDKRRIAKNGMKDRRVRLGEVIKYER